MTWSTENAKDVVEKNMFIVMRPRRRATSWTLSSGSVYYNDFSYGYVTSVSVNGTALTLDTSSSCAAGKYYFDSTLNRLYVRKSDSTAIAGSDWVVVVFELYISTKATSWYRNPTDNTSLEVYWHGIITDTPTITRSISDNIFGYSPVQNTSVSCFYEKEYLQEIIYDSSFSLAEVVIYHNAGSLSTGNIQKIFTGVLGDYRFDDNKIDFQILDKSYRLDTLLDNSASDSYHSILGASPNTDPTFSGGPIRTIYGMKSGVRPIDIDYYAAADVSVNRKWSMMTDAWGTNILSPTVTATTTTTKTVSVADAIKMKRAYDAGFQYIVSGAGWEPALISSINTGTGVITHSVCGAADSTFYLRPITQRLTSLFSAHLILLQNGYSIVYAPTGAAGPNVIFTDGTDHLYFTIRDETTVSSIVITTINPADGDYFVMDKVLGADIAPTISGSTFGHSWNPVTILYHFIKDRLGFAESEIDTAQFSSLASSVDWLCGFNTIEDENQEDHPTYLDVITKLCTTALVYSYIDEDGRFTIKAAGPAAVTPDLSITDADIIQVDYDFSYSDVSSVRVLGQKIEHYLVGGAADDAPDNGYPYEEAKNQYEIDETVQMNVQNYLHQIDRERQIDTYFISHSQSGLTASQYATRIAEFLGERKGRVTCYVKAGAHGLDIGDTVQITRTRQPGYAYDGQTEQSRKYIIAEITKELGGVKIVLDDQKGIEDNTGDW